MIAARLSAALVLLSTVFLPSSPAAAESIEPGFTDNAGIHVVSAQQVDDRLWALSVSSPALGRAVRVRILLPEGYGTSETQRYPVLYLFHGTSGGADDWIDVGDVEATTAGLPLIVVMPDAGFDGSGGGWFTDWHDPATKLGPSRWETFHIDQLVPWVDSSLRTVAARGGRAVAGLSQGGFGAMSYAARHPDMFAAAASFSGAPEIDRDVVVIPFSTAVIEAIAVGLNGVPPGSIFGPRATHEINWAGHDPATLIPNLRGMALFLWTATGLPGQYDNAMPNPGANTIEAITYMSTSLFHQHLEEAGIPSHYDDYFYGTHTWPYWAQDLRELVGPLMDVFAHPVTPTTVSYQSIDQTWTQWGWTVTNHRSAQQEFSGIAAADADGFTLSCLGSADVTTPGFYEPLSTHVAVISGPSGKATRTLEADAGGQLHLDLDCGGLLGPVSVNIG